MTTCELEWDAKSIAKIAKDHYGSFKAMFEAHGWPERGAKMMTAARRGSWLSGARLGNSKPSTPQSDWARESEKTCLSSNRVHAPHARSLSE